MENPIEKVVTELLKRSGGDVDALAREIALLLPKGQLASLASSLTKAAAGGQAGVSGAADITILVGSNSGNGIGFARKAMAQAERYGFKARICGMGTYKPRDIRNEKNILAIISTHGEGVPPVSAEGMFEFLASNRAPRLEGIHFSVLALGDKSYVHFCKAGIDLDQAFERLGASRITARVDCDVDFKDTAEQWLKNALEALKDKAPLMGFSSGDPQRSGFLTAPIPEAPEYSAKRPYMATVLSKVNLNGRGSIKETYHIELSIDRSGIQYQPGDACGLLPCNSERMVTDVLLQLGFKGNEEVQPSGTLGDALKGLEITVLSPDVLKKHNVLAGKPELDALLSDVGKLREYLYGRDFIDLLKDFPVSYSLSDVLTILRPIPARLYSIASSPSTYPGEVHLLVSAVRYNAFGRYKEGVGSTFWADRILEGGQVPVYIKSNEAFRLPADGSVPVIMVGPGSGIAPFRSFVEERAARGDTGKNWLFFGNPHFTTDFLYQIEWQEHLKNGILARLDTAFSQDQEEKVYVQHKILKEAKDVFSWIESGAYIYVCGDMKRMAPDVNNAFVSVAQQEGGLLKEEAIEYVKSLKRSGRYVEDVY